MSCDVPRIAKALTASALMLAVCVLAAGQDSTSGGGHGVVVRSYGWQRERPGWDRPAVDRGMPLGDGSHSGGIPAVGGVEPLPEPGYRYKAKVENAGRRQVRAVVWEYRVTERATRRATAHRFRSALRLKPGASAELRAFAYVQPSGVVSADSAGKEYREAFEETVVILRVEYADGSAWEAK
jgi:hypothetical protein